MKEKNIKKTKNHKIWRGKGKKRKKKNQGILFVGFFCKPLKPSKEFFCSSKLLHDTSVHSSAPDFKRNINYEKI